MTIFAKFDRHADLFARMADTIDADLGGAAITGRLTEEGLRRAVFACMGCDRAGACEGWLDAHAPGGADAPPSFCRNTGLFQRLAEG